VADKRDELRRWFRGRFADAIKHRDEFEWPVVQTTPRVDDKHESFADAYFAAGVIVAEDPWLVMGILRVTSDGPPYISELSVEHFPDPDVEVTGAVLRFPLAEIRDKAVAEIRGPLLVVYEAMAEIGDVTPETLERVESMAKKAENTRPGRRAKPPEHYRRIALRYLELLKQGQRHVLKALAAEESEREGRTVPRETVRDWVRKATKLGYLMPGTQGRASARPGPKLYRKEKGDG
jgi:hypothetical protein